MGEAMRFVVPLTLAFAVYTTAKGQLWEDLADGPEGIKYGLYANDTALLINAQYADTPYPNHVFQFSNGNWTDLVTEEISSAGNPTRPFIIFNHKILCYHSAGGNGVGLFEYTGIGWDMFGAIDGKVWGMREYDDTLYIYGQFSSINGDSSLYQIVKYDGEYFYPVADTLYYGPTAGAVVRDMVIYEGHIIAVGRLKTASGQYHIARWDGEAWQDVGAGFPYLAMPTKMTIHDGLLVINGWPNGLSGPGNPIVAWDGERFLSMEGPVWPAGAESMLSYNGALYVSGYRMVASLPIPYFARWDGERWCYFNTGQDVVQGMVEFQGRLYAHLFHSEDMMPIHRIAKMSETAMPDSCGEVVHLAIGEQEDETDVVRIFPNPTTSLLTIRFERPMRQLHINDAMGRLVVSKIASGKEHSMDVSALAPGLYVLRAETESGWRNARFVRE